MPINLVPNPDQCSIGVAEAEAGRLSGTAVAGVEQLASGGGYAGAPEGSGSYWNGPTEPNKIELCFDVLQAGMYGLSALVSTSDGLSDSFYVVVNGDSANHHRAIIPDWASRCDRGQLRDAAAVERLSASNATVGVWLLIGLNASPRLGRRAST